MGGLSGVSGVSGLSGIVGGEAAPQWFEVEVTTTAPNETYSWQITSGTAINAVTEWGDGTTSTHTAVGIYTKTYAAAGVYRIRIQASFGSGGAFNMRPNADRTRLTRLRSPIPGFTGLAGIPSFLAACTGLTGEIPANFLRYVTSVTTLTFAINNCPGLTGAIAVDFLRDVTAVTNFSGLFQGSTQLRIQPDIFGASPSTRFLNQSPNFGHMFRNTGTSAPQGTAPDMWNYNYGTGTPITSGAFALQTSASLSNFNSIPAGWL